VISMFPLPPYVTHEYVLINDDAMSYLNPQI
jgi:hypothetical protein